MTAQRTASIARRLPAVLLAATLAFAPFGVATAQESVRAFADAEAVLDGHVRPTFAALAASTHRLAGAVDSFCAEPAPDARAGLDDAFRQALADWSGAEMLRFGPLVEENRFERLYFWPDRRGIALRQVQGALAEEDESVTEAASLAEKSVALQGFVALEFLLHGSGSADLVTGEAPFRCRFAGAVARNIAVIAGNIDTEWRNEDGHAALLMAPGPDNPLYRDQGEVAAEFYGLAAQGLEIVDDFKLAPMLGEGPESARPRMAPFWRSGATFEAIAANLASIEALIETGGLTAALPAEDAYVADTLAFEFDNAIGTLRGLHAPVAPALSDPETHGAARYVAIVVSSLRDTLARRVGSTLGLSAGFSSTDGD